MRELVLIVGLGLAFSSTALGQTRVTFTRYGTQPVLQGEGIPLVWYKVVGPPVFSLGSGQEILHVGFSQISGQQKAVLTRGAGKADHSVLPPTSVVGEIHSSKVNNRVYLATTGYSTELGRGTIYYPRSNQPALYIRRVAR